MKKHFFLYILLLFSNILWSQEIVLQGKVTDSLRQPVVYANVMAEVIDTLDIPPAFAMTDEQGQYKINLLKKFAYKLSVLSMGYEKYVFKVDSLSGNLVKNIVLKEAKNQLDEVVITADIPVKVTQDSIVYKTDKFKTGEERKLKDVLKKLPGFEVGKNGQVSVMGKKVSKVLVEGKEFFGGGTELAVENIPADAVDKVTAVDDYNSVGFMRGLTDEQKMIINIKLKEGKKRFVFGDIYAGGSNDKKYLGKSNLFYYSPKTNLSYIGSLNNTGEAPMEISDFMRFEGSSMNFDKMRSSFQNFKNISSIIFGDNFVDKKIRFQAFQWQQDFGEKIEFSTYVIYNNDKQTAKQNTEKQFITNNLTENRTDTNNQEFETLIGKWHWRHKSSVFNYLDLEISGNWQNQQTFSNIFSRYANQEQFIDKNTDNENYNFTANIAWHRRFNKHNTLRLLSNIQIKQNTPEERWYSNQELLNPLLPIQNDAVYNLYQELNTKTKEAYVELKHYWVIDSKQHIYTSAGTNYADTKFASNTCQKLTNQSINTFEPAGFNNRLHLQLNDAFAGLQYKRKINKIIIKAGLFAHRYSWHFDQGQNRQKINLLPELKIERKYNFSKKISFNYALKSTIPDVLKYADRFYLNGYSSVSKGNASIENELYHQFLLTVNNYSFSKKHQYYIRLQYNWKLNPVKNRIVYDNIYTYQETNQIQLIENKLNASLYYKLDFKKFYIKLRPFYQYAQYNQNIQGNWQEIQNFVQNYNLSAGTYFKDFPNFNAGTIYTVSQTVYGQSFTNSKQITPFIKIDYDFFKNFILTADFEYQINYDTNNTRNVYPRAGFTLSFQKENNPWGFEITGKNLFNTAYLENISYGPYVIIKQYIYKQPVLIMFKVSYKL